MHVILKRFLASLILACFPLLFSACSGGGSGAVEMTTISGLTAPVTTGALVQVFKLNSDGTKGELLGSGTSAGNGTFSIQIPKSKAVPPLLVTSSGQAGATYTSPTTGASVPFTSSETFRAVLDAYDPAKSISVSPLTEAAYQQVQKFLTETPAAVADTRIISAANARVATLFNVADILADPATDPSYAAALKIIDQMVVDSGSASTLQTLTLINQAFVDVNSKAYQNYQTALTAAATTVVADNPALAIIVGTIVNAVDTPPAEPSWTDTTAPRAVTGLQAVPGSEATTSSVSLFWGVATTTGANPVVGYDIYRNGSKIASVATTHYVDQPLTLSTTYKYYVVAFDAAGNRSLPSPEISTTTPSAPNLNITVGGQLTSGALVLPFKDITAPTAPSNLAATYISVNATTSSVTLTWTAAVDNVAVTGYDVYRDGTKLGTAPQTSYTDPSVSSGVSHSYTVVAFDAAGYRSVTSSALTFIPVASNLIITVGGQISSDTSALPFKDINAPTAPSNLAATYISISAATSSVTLTWTAAVDNVAVIGYDVYRDGTKLGTATQTSYTDPSVSSGVSHSYTVVAFDAAGYRSVTSSALTFIPVASNLIITIGGQISSDTSTLPFNDINAPAAPLNLSATYTSITATTSSVTLRWSAAVDNVAVTGYDVYRGAVKIGTAVLPSYIDPTVTSGVASIYTVIAYDAAGNRSTASAPLSVTPVASNLIINVGGQVL